MRFVEPESPRQGRRHPVPGSPSAWAGGLLAAALLTGGAATGIDVVTSSDPAASACYIGASQARLNQARHLVTALRLDGTSDPRSTALARDLRALGVTPATSSGWRQQAVDISDQLRGTTDPTMRRVAITLARNGVGPTPADLVRDGPSGPVQDLLNVGKQAPGVDDAITAAGHAMAALPPASTLTTGPLTHNGQAPRSGVDSPEPCSRTDDAGTGDSGPDGTTATADPPASDEPDQIAPAGPRTTPPSIPPSETSTPDSDRATTTSSPSPGTDDTSAGRPDAPADLRSAASVVEALANLLWSLSEQSTPDAEQLAEQIRRLLPELNGTGAADRSNSSAPDADSTDPTTPQSPSASAPSSRTIAPSATHDPDEAGTDDWTSQASDLAEKAHQAAGNDPLARELASTLDAAGFGGDGTEATTDRPAAGTTKAVDAADPSTRPTSAPDSSRPDPSTPETSEAPDPDGEPRRPSSGGVDAATWDRLAECESSGDWAAETGNGYAGGLQFDPATWAAFGGQGSAAAASRDAQIAVAEKVRDAQGWAAWPACSQKLGLR